MVASGYSSQWKALDYAKIWKGELQKRHWDMFEMHKQPFTRNKPPKTILTAHAVEATQEALD